MSHIQTKIKNNAKFLVLFSSFLLLLLTIKLVCVFYLVNPTEIKPALADGATFVVDSIEDDSDDDAGDGSCDIGDGTCTLRAAIEEVNAGTGGDTINFSITGTITMTSCYSYIWATSTTITGPGPDQLTIDGSGCTNDPIARISGSNISISDLKIINSKSGLVLDPNPNSITGDTIHNIVFENSTTTIMVYGSATLGGNTVSYVTISSSTLPVGIGLGNGFDHITIDGNIINNSGITMSGTNVAGYNTIQNNTITDSAHSAIYLDGDQDNNTISNNTIYSSGARGIDIRTGSDSNIIQNNLIGSSSWDGIGIFNVENTIISGNTATSTVSGNGINLSFATSTTISNNTTNSNSSAGIYVNASDGTTISSSTASSNSGNGISIYNANDITISSSTASSNISNGIYFSNVATSTIQNSTTFSNTQNGLNLTSVSTTTIENNIISSNTNYGISMDYSDYITISNNTTSNNYLPYKMGIMIQNGENNLVTGNTLSDAVLTTITGPNNTISNNTFNGSGVSLQSSGNLISGNTISSASAEGISIHKNGNAGDYTRDNTIQNNTITDSTTIGIMVGYTVHGANYNAGQNNIITGNTISGSGQQGIYVWAASTTISSNTIYSNTNNGIEINTSGNNLVSSNTIFSNATTSAPSYTMSPVGGMSYDGNSYVYSASFFDGEGVSEGLTIYTDPNTMFSLNENNTVIEDYYGTYDAFDLVLLNYVEHSIRFIMLHPNITYANGSELQTAFDSGLGEGVISVDYFANDALVKQENNDYTWQVSEEDVTQATPYTYLSSYSPLSYNEADYYVPGNEEVEGVFFMADGGPAQVNEDDFDISAVADGTNNFNLILLNLPDAGDLKLAFFLRDDIWADAETFAAACTGGFDMGTCVPDFWQDDVFTVSGSEYVYNAPEGVTVVDGFTDPPTITTLASTAVWPPIITATEESYLYSAISLSTATSTTITNNTLYNNGNGITFAGTSDGNTVDEGTITSLGYDIQHSASGNNILDNVPYTSTNVTAGQVDVYYDTRGYVKDSGGSPISGAVCSVAPEAGGSSTSLGTTDATGYTSYTAVNAFDIDSTGIINGNSHIMTATKNAANYTSSATAIDSINKTISISSAPLSNIGGLGSAGISSGQTTPTTEGDTTTDDSESGDTETGDNTEEDTTQDDADTENTTDNSTTENNSTDTPTDSSGSDSATPTPIDIAQIMTDAQAVAQSGKNVNTILSNSGKTQSTSEQTASMSKYTDPIATGASAETKTQINNFIVYGTKTTNILGVGERAGVVNSYKSAFGKLPQTEADWSDVVKIANGRWPTQRDTTAEDRALINFRITYRREPDRTNPHDDAAITVLAYGLRPGNRNLDSEKQAIKIFRDIYGYNPQKATAWDVVRAIAYSGAIR